MAKIMGLAVSENEEHVFQDIQSYLKLKTAYTSTALH